MSEKQDKEKRKSFDEIIEQKCEEWQELEKERLAKRDRFKAKVCTFIDRVWSFF